MKTEIKYNPCPEFPFFGAKYPDARCIEGRLYDMDKCDDNGNLYVTGDEPPCPFCNLESFIEYHIDDGDFEEGGNPVLSREKVIAWVDKLKAETGYTPPQE